MNATIPQALEKADLTEDLAIELNLDFSDLGDLEPEMKMIAADAASKTLGKYSSNLFNQINQRAIDYARDRAAELVSQIDDATRDKVRAAIADGLANKLTAQQIADSIQNDSSIFGDDRAQLIADTEIANANGEGALAGLEEGKEIGLAVKKQWLDHDGACEICEENADAGPIDVEDSFPSGDDAPLAHPNCRCTLIGVIDED